MDNQHQGGNTQIATPNSAVQKTASNTNGQGGKSEGSKSEGSKNKKPYYPRRPKPKAKPAEGEVAKVEDGSKQNNQKPNNQNQANKPKNNGNAQRNHQNNGEKSSQNSQSRNSQNGNSQNANGQNRGGQNRNSQNRNNQNRNSQNRNNRPHHARPATEAVSEGTNLAIAANVTNATAVTVNTNTKTVQKKNPMLDIKNAVLDTAKKFTTKSTTRRNTPVQAGNLSIIPLGGMGEIGKNMTVFKYGKNMVVIDGGMTFPDDDLLGIDIVLPDYKYLIENKAMVRGIFITHGHEDHIGALPYVLKELKVPVYGSRLTLGLLKGKLKEHNVQNVELIEVEAGETVTAGPFKGEFIHVSHSIPDAMAIALHTPAGVVLHTGDFKIDMSPVDGEFMDLARFAKLGEDGVLMMMADSTNVEREGFTPSETSVGKKLEAIFLDATGRIILTTFASNVHRVQQAIWAAEIVGRKVAVVGRGMNNVVGISSELGYLKVKAGTLIDINDINKYPDNKVVVITTGSQGETLAGLTRMSVGEHRQVSLRKGDLIVISANAIPGNEKAIGKTIDNLYRLGVDVIYGRGAGIHVSGHASKEDLKLVFNLVKPKYFMPAHGEYAMLCEHSKLAAQMGVPADNIFLLANGQVLELNETRGNITGTVHSGKILVDGRGVGDVGTTVLKDRKQLSNDGIVIASVVIDRDNCTLLSMPYIFSRGFVYEKGNDQIFREAEKKIVQIIDGFQDKEYNNAQIKAQIRNVMGKLCYDKTGRRPIIVPIVNEI